MDKFEIRKIEEVAEAIHAGKRVLSEDMSGELKQASGELQSSLDSVGSALSGLEMLLDEEGLAEEDRNLIKVVVRDAAKAFSSLDGLANRLNKHVEGK